MCLRASLRASLLRAVYIGVVGREGGRVSEYLLIEQEDSRKTDRRSERTDAWCVVHGVWCVEKGDG